MLNNLSLTRLFSEDNQEAEDNFDLTPKPAFKHISVPVISPAQFNAPAPLAVQIPSQAPIQTQQSINEGYSSLEYLNAFGEEVSMSPLSLNGK